MEQFSGKGWFVITVTDLGKIYHQGTREIRALDGVSLSVPSGTVHGIVGQSGAGKSTLVRCLAMLDRPSWGSVEINGLDLTSVRSDRLRNARRRLGMVFQHANLFDSRTITRNVTYPLELAKMPRQQQLARAQELLSLVGLGDAGDAYPAQLSGGQRQRVGIARALATDPDVLLCDEPTSALDPRTTDEILDLIAQVRDRLGLAVLVITHEMHVVKRLCDSVSLLEKGRIVESGNLVDVVKTLDGRLSEALLGIPAHNPADEVGARLIDVLASGELASGPLVAHVSRGFDADLSIVAGSVEHLAGTTFSHLRLSVPPDVSAAAVVDAFKARGADAKLTDQHNLNGGA